MGQGGSQIVRCTFSREYWDGCVVAWIWGRRRYSRDEWQIDYDFRQRLRTQHWSRGRIQRWRIDLGWPAALLSNVTFLANTALNSAGGAAFDVQGGAKVTAINCFALAKPLASDRQLSKIPNSQCINSTFAESHSNAGTFTIHGEDSVFAAYGSVFRDNTVDCCIAAIHLHSKARGSLTDCLVIGNVVTAGSGRDWSARESSMSVLRTTFRNNRAGTQDGCFQVSVGSLTIDDSDI